MVNDIKSKLTDFFASENKKVKIVVIIGALGMILILLSSLGDGAKKENKSSEAFDYSSYTQQLEHKLTEIISQISGVGECKVMVTLENSSENVYATDSEIRNDDNTLNQ